MKFHTTPLADAMLIEQTPFGDERGIFARAYCAEEFTEAGLPTQFLQMNMSGCARAGTLRGLHYQSERAPEAKLLRCIRGAVFDVLVDMRRASPTYLKSWGVELSAQNRLAVYVPPLFAHGYLALEDDTEVLYQVTAPYAPEHELGVRYDDPMLAIDWPIAITEVSEKDRNWPDLSGQGFALPDNNKD
jgi:dTDP-4-dehydrorhamnose 3,5-epimerase